MNSMNLKFGDVTARRSPTFSDCNYVKKIIFSLDYCFLSMFSIFVALLNTVWHFLISRHNFSLFIQVPRILFYGDLLTSKTHPYKHNSMNSMNELWKNSNSLFTLHGNGMGRGTGNWTSTMGNNEPWFLSLSQTSVNISVQYIRTHWSRCNILR